MLLTQSTEGLISFFNEHSHDQGLFNNSISLIRKGSADVVNTADFIADRKEPIANNVTQRCKPAFPIKNAWFGGDGDVSIPLSSSTTLFIFSDTWIGREKQKTRREGGMKMVSNSVAVATCLSNGETDVNYFWNNMYSENPEPIFKTFTKRYKYWVPGAFVINENLYVLLEKVGKKLGSSPNELFNFSLLGYTLAKICNPTDSPNEWKIEYNPLTEFKNPYTAIGAIVKKDKFIYFFLSRNDKAQVLVRKHVDHIDSTESDFEYYALNKTWKVGLDTSDMDTLIDGFRSTTVSYHQEMKQWVMICDIQFMDNKIKMRTAPELTGPWSNEIDIYEIPEVTPGNPSYNESNFCYLPRECIQNYDSKKHEMILTYDINNSDFSKINADPTIYVPKVISVKLK
jgi:hypothetical protein